MRRGTKNFINQLVRFFPDEEQNIENYCRKVIETCDSFPLYNLQADGKYDSEILGINAKKVH